MDSLPSRSEDPDIVIDFDEASAAWMANKIRRGHMTLYRCTATQKNGEQCKNPILCHKALTPLTCKRHQSPPSMTLAKGKSLRSKDSA